MDSLPAGISITRNEITGSARVEIELGPATRPLAYRVTRQLGTDRYVIRDPFGAAIDGVSSLERAIEIATGLAEAISLVRQSPSRAGARAPAPVLWGARHEQRHGC